MRNLNKVEKSIKIIAEVLTPEVNAILEKAFDKMGDSFSSDWFLIVAREEGLPEKSVDDDAHRIYLSAKAKNTHGRLWNKLPPDKTATIPNNGHVGKKQKAENNIQQYLFDSNTEAQMPAISFQEAKAVIEQHGYIVCRKEVTITPI